MMLTVDVNSNCVRYAAEAIPLYEPLLESGGSGRSGKSLRQLLQDYNLYGTSLLFLAALSTLSLILFVAFRYDPTSTMDPPIVVGDALLDALTNLGWSVDDWYNDTESPQYQAWKWMRPSMMGPGSEAVAITALLERFALVTLYAATNGPKWTRGFGFLTSPSASSLNALCDENDGSRSDGAMVCDDTGTSVTMLTLGMWRLTYCLHWHILLRALSLSVVSLFELRGHVWSYSYSVFFQFQFCILYAGYNMMEGTIPPELALLSNLEVLDLCRFIKCTCQALLLQRSNTNLSCFSPVHFLGH